MKRMQYDDKIAIVTGAASGIGRALSEELARRNAEVVLADRQESVALEAAASIRAAGGRARGVALDVRDAGAFQQLAEATAQRCGRIDLLFNNAGIVVGGEARHYAVQDWDDVFDVNVRGVAYGVQAVYPIMIAQGFGHIVNTSSTAGIMAIPEGSYTASKYAVTGLSRALRIEAKRQGVNVSMLCPGPIRTPMFTGGAFGRMNFPGANAEKVAELLEGFRPMDADVFARLASRCGGAQRGHDRAAAVVERAVVPRAGVPLTERRALGLRRRPRAREDLRISQPGRIMIAPSSVDESHFTLGAHPTAEHLEFFDRYGFIRFRNFASSEEVERLIEEADRIARSWVEQRREKIYGIPIYNGVDESGDPYLTRLPFVSLFSDYIHDFVAHGRFDPVLDFLEPGSRVAEREYDGVNIHRYMNVPGSEHRRLGWHTDAARELAFLRVTQAHAQHHPALRSHSRRGRRASRDSGEPQAEPAQHGVSQALFFLPSSRPRRIHDRNLTQATSPCTTVECGIAWPGQLIEEGAALVGSCSFLVSPEMRISRPNRAPHRFTTNCPT